MSEQRIVLIDDGGIQRAELVEAEEAAMPALPPGEVPPLVLEARAGRKAFIASIFKLPGEISAAHFDRPAPPPRGRRTLRRRGQ